MNHSRVLGRGPGGKGKGDGSGRNCEGNWEPLNSSYLKVSQIYHFVVSLQICPKVLFSSEIKGETLEYSLKDGR